MRKYLNNIINSLPLLFLLLLAVALLTFPEVTRIGADQGLKICAEAIIPALFPFFVVTNLWCSLGYASRLGAIAAPVMERVFHLPGITATSFIMGLIGGYPVGAQTVVQQYQCGSVQKNEAEHLLLFCNNAGPAFAFGILGAKVFQSPGIGLTLYLIHICSAIITGVLFRGKFNECRTTDLMTVQRKSISSAITDAIRQAGTTVIQVCIFVVFFSVISSFLQHFLPISWTKTLFVKFLIGSLELAGGSILLADVRQKEICFCVAAFLLGWGGLCVFFQTTSILDATDLNTKKYMAAKFLQSLWSAVFAIIISPFMPFKETTAYIAPHKNANYYIYIMIALLIATLLVGFLKKSSGNAARDQV